MLYAKAFRSVSVAFAVVTSMALYLPAAHATLNGRYLIRNAGNNQCLRAPNISALHVVNFAACDANDSKQIWRVVEVARTAYDYGINVVSIRDGAGNKFCLAGANYYTSKPHLKECDGGSAQHWITGGPIDYPETLYGHSYRMRWEKNADLCSESGGSAVSHPYLDNCVGKDNADRVNQQWYFHLQQQ